MPRVHNTHDIGWPRPGAMSRDVPAAQLVIELDMGKAVAPDDGQVRTLPLRLVGQDVMLDLGCLTSSV